MKKDKKIFIIIELVLAAIVVALIVGMLQGRNKKDRDKIAVIIENSDDNQWSAFKYGLEMAAEDMDAELFVVGMEGNLTAQEQQAMIEDEMENGADAVIIQPAAGEDAGEMLKKISKKIPLILLEEITGAEKNISGIPVVGTND